MPLHDKTQTSFKAQDFCNLGPPTQIHYLLMIQRQTKNRKEPQRMEFLLFLISHYVF